MKAFFCWTVYGMLGASTAMAQGDQVQQIIRNNRALPAYRQGVESNFSAYEAGLSTHCASATYDWNAARIQVVQHGRILPDGNADGTAWEENVPGHACGQTRNYRVLVSLHDGQGTMQPLLPGGGWAGPLLERDTMTQVYAAAAAYSRQRCSVDVVDTHLASGTPSADPKAPWTEVWTVQSCGKRFGVPIAFTPDRVGSGTSMSVQGSAIKPLP